ncbi:wall-associated receptor kinase 5-like [Carex rostrata]
MACVRQLQLQCLLYLTLINLLSSAALVASTTLNMSLPGCPEKCGSITIPYPFGIGPNCCRNGFNIMCDESTNPPKAFMSAYNFESGGHIEIIDMNITSGEAVVYNLISYRCYNEDNNVSLTNKQAFVEVELMGLPYLFSNRRNKFITIGCQSFAYLAITGDTKRAMLGCYSYCASSNFSPGKGGLCDGLGCCQTSIPSELNYFGVHWNGIKNSGWRFNPCFYAALMEEDRYKFQVEDLSKHDFLDRNPNGVPAVLDWAIRDSGAMCQNGVEQNPNPACRSKNSTCNNTSNGDGYLCQCIHGFEGNPYIPDGCIDIDECKFPDKYPCFGNCRNTEGSYECFCKEGTKGNATTGSCIDNFSKTARVVIYCILGIAVLLGLCILLIWYLQHKRHMKEKKEYNAYYQMMANHLRMFSKKEIENATDNYSDDRVLGRGGQGKVYKGVIENNQVVAIKKALELKETPKGEFVNEIILLSQINHKNIVRLLGCCLEDKIPMLVYEFVPNGTLFELLHGNSRTRPISLSTRLKVALDSAEALDYLHSSVIQTILHGDIKSANILLENGYRAKVSDFGASNLVPIDDTDVAKVVQGTRGYIDPEYFATGILTKKSDVYSFGVVLLELITRKCAIFRDETYERKHLASCFVSNASKNNLHELLDKDIVGTNEKVIEVLQEVSELAVWCLCVIAEDRPTMRQVVEKLQNFVKLHGSQLGPERVQEETDSSLDEATFYTASDASALHSIGFSSVLEMETGMPR